MSKESDAAFEFFWNEEGADMLHGTKANTKKVWDKALDWCRPLAAEAIRKAKAIPPPKKRRTPKSPKSPFTPPTEAEVRPYMVELGMPAEEAGAFCDHHSARKWTYRGGQLMADWKAAVRTWKRNQEKFANGNGKTRSLGCD